MSRSDEPSGGSSGRASSRFSAERNRGPARIRSARQGRPVRRILVGIKVLLLGLWALALIPVQTLAVRFGWPVQHRVPVWFHRVLLRLFGVRVIERGRPPGGDATLVLANHVSWLDIP